MSDIIFLQKRDHPIDIESDWVHLGQTSEGLTLNSYFIDHPEMVLGQLTTESTQYGKQECTVLPIPGMELSEQLKEAVSHIRGSYAPQAITEQDFGEVPDSIPADPNVKNFSYTVVSGEIFFRENSVMRPVDLNEKMKGRIKGLVALRQIVNELIDYQMNDYPEEDIAAKASQINVKLLPLSNRKERVFMGYRLTLAEKPSVAQTIAKVLGATKRCDGYLEGNGWLVSWCVGHLVELAEPESYDEKYSKWRYEDLPIFPEKWKYEVSASTQKQFAIVKQLMNREDVTEIAECTDSGREGELIYRLSWRPTISRHPVSPRSTAVTCAGWISSRRTP